MALKKRTKPLHLMIVSIFLAALLGACGATNTPVPAASTTAPVAAATTAPVVAATTAPISAATTAPAVATTVAQTTASGTFRFREASEPKTLDPGFVTDAVGIRTGQNIYEGLVEFNEKLEVVPAAAEALPTVSADGKVFTFKVRKDLKWSNNDPLTAKDFVYAWNRVAQIGAPAQYGFVMSEIKGFNEIYTEKDDAKRKAATVPGIKLVDDYTIEITLVNPASYFLTETALWTYWPVNQKVVEAKGSKYDEKNTWSTEAANFVGNGPFVIKEWKHDVSMRMEVNPNYTGKVKPTIAAVTVDYIKEDATSKLKFDNGELDDVIVPVTDIQTTKKDAKYKGIYKEFPQARTTWLAFGFGQKSVISDNIKVRQAMAYAMDRPFITDGALQGSAIPTTVLIPEGFLGYKALDSYPFNVDKAKAMLKEAGYDTPDKLKQLEDEINNFGGGKSGGIAFNSDSSSNKAFCEAVQQLLKQNLGLNIKLNPVATFKEFIKRRDEDHEFIMFRGSWGADFPDPQNFYESMFSSTSESNNSKYNNPQYDEAVKKGNTATTLSARGESYQLAEKILQDNAAYVPLFSGIETRLIRPTIQGYSYTAQQPTLWKYMSIKK